MEIITLIIFGCFLIAAFTGGFFLGHWQRKDALPEKMPTIKQVIEAVTPEKPVKLTRFEEAENAKANTFYN